MVQCGLPVIKSDDFQESVGSLETKLGVLAVGFPRADDGGWGNFAQTKEFYQLSALTFACKIGLIFEIGKEDENLLTKQKNGLI